MINRKKKHNSQANTEILEWIFNYCLATSESYLILNSHFNSLIISVQKDLREI